MEKRKCLLVVSVANGYVLYCTLSIFKKKQNILTSFSLLKEIMQIILVHILALARPSVCQRVILMIISILWQLKVPNIELVQGGSSNGQLIKVPKATCFERPTWEGLFKAILIFFGHLNFHKPKNVQVYGLFYYVINLGVWGRYSHILPL